MNETETKNEPTKKDINVEVKNHSRRPWPFLTNLEVLPPLHFFLSKYINLLAYVECKNSHFKLFGH